MSPVQPRDSWARSFIRSVVVVLLVLIVAAGVYARSHTALTFSAASHLSSTPVTIMFTVIEALGALFVLLVALTIRRRRKNPEEEQHVMQLPGKRWMGLAATTTVLAMTLLLAYWLIEHFRGTRQGHRALPSVGGSSPGPTQHAVSGTPPSGSHALWLVWLGVVLLAIVAVVVVTLWRRYRERTALPVLEDEPAADAGGTALHAGRRALDASTDPRDAVIACYEAMERSLADAGVDRTPAQTPEELLARAQRRNAVGAEHAAEILVNLFGRARFSGRTVDTSDVANARTALTELLRDMPDRVGS